MKATALRSFLSARRPLMMRKAIGDIFSGTAKGDSPFTLFAGTFKYVLEPQFVDISVNIDGKK